MACLHNDDLHDQEKDEKERKQLEKLQPRVLTLYSNVDLFLACNKPIFELPNQERLKVHSRELEIWVRLVTPPTVKRALADAAQYLHNTNYTITALLTPARLDPMTTNELANELRPVLSHGAFDSVFLLVRVFCLRYNDSFVSPLLSRIRLTVYCFP